MRIEYDYIARYEPRATGRTTKMIMSMPSANEIEGKIYIVGLHLEMAKAIIRGIEKIRGHELASRCVPLSSSNCQILRAVDPFNVFIDHTALEYAKLEDIKFLYHILDQQNLFN